MITKLAYWLAFKLAKKAERDDIDYIRYGIEVVFGALIKLIVFIIVGIVLGILIELFSIIIAFIIFRVISGGVHMSTYLRCLTSSLILFVTPAYLLQNNYFVIPPLSYILLTFIISIPIIYFYVPVEAENRAISAEKHQFFKTLSFLFITGWLIISLIIYIFYPKLLILIFFSAIGILLQSFTLTPFGYRLFHFIDQHIQKNKKLEVNTNEEVV